jgi:flagellin-like hook-associated protein FlgL
LVWKKRRNGKGNTNSFFFFYNFAGYYVLAKSFYWGENSDSYEEAFQPKVVIGFASDSSRSNFDLGGANTNQCSGDTFMNWTTGVTKSATNTLRTFFATFGILFGAVVALGGAAFYLSRQANATPKQPIGAFDAEDLDEHDYHKIAMVGNNRNLVDF